MLWSLRCKWMDRGIANIRHIEIVVVVLVGEEVMTLWFKETKMKFVICFGVGVISLPVWNQYTHTCTHTQTQTHHQTFFLFITIIHKTLLNICIPEEHLVVETYMWKMYIKFKLRRVEGLQVDWAPIWAHWITMCWEEFQDKSELQRVSQLTLSVNYEHREKERRGDLCAICSC